MAEADINATPFTESLCSHLNNLGASLLLAGNRRGAAQLFEGALAVARSALPEQHLGRMWAVAASCLATTACSQQTMDASRRVAAASNTFPYLIVSPILIPEHHDIPLHDRNLLQKATILFNMGITHQLDVPHCSEVPRLYHLATYALHDVPDSTATFTLAVALLNNAGVWCHANGEPEKGRSCMERIAELIADEDEFSLDPSLSEQGILTNVRVMLGNEATWATPAA